MIESYWLVHIMGSAPVPVDANSRSRIESALSEKGIEIIYFTDIFDPAHEHIVPRAAIAHIEYVDKELAKRRADHNAVIYELAGNAYFERRPLGLATLK